MAALLFLALAFSGRDLPGEVVKTDSVSVIEVNHVYNDEGVEFLHQVIFWDWLDNTQPAGFQVVAWRMYYQGKMRVQKVRGGYKMYFVDGDQMRVIFATSYRETWTQYDPERWAADNVRPAMNRRELSGKWRP